MWEVSVRVLGELGDSLDGSRSGVDWGGLSVCELGFCEMELLRGGMVGVLLCEDDGAMVVDDLVK